MSSISNNFTRATTALVNDPSSPEDTLTKYRNGQKGKAASAASAGDKQKILGAVEALKLTRDEALTILHALGETLPKECNELISEKDFNKLSPQTTLVNKALTKLRNDHRSLSFFHHGSTESYKVAVKYLINIAKEGTITHASNGTVSRGKGHGAFGLFAATTYSMTYQIKNIFLPLPSHTSIQTIEQDKYLNINGKNIILYPKSTEDKSYYKYPDGNNGGATNKGNRKVTKPSPNLYFTQAERVEFFQKATENGYKKYFNVGLLKSEQNTNKLYESAGVITGEAIHKSQEFKKLSKEEQISLVNDFVLACKKMNEDGFVHTDLVVGNTFTGGIRGLSVTNFLYNVRDKCINAIDFSGKKINSPEEATKFRKEDYFNNHEGVFDKKTQSLNTKLLKVFC